MKGQSMKRPPLKRSPAKRSAGDYVVVLVTCASRREAGQIARSVVERQLAACVNILDAPVRSVYRWRGKIEQGREFLLLVKTSRSRLAAIQAEVERLHSYEIPEFIAIPIVGGSPSYLEWLGQCLNAQTKKR